MTSATLLPPTPASTPASWRARWLVAPGRTAWADFPTRDQADLFALRRPGGLVDVVPLPERSLAVVPDEVDADRFARLVDGEAAPTDDERRMLDVVAGLRRVLPASVPGRVSRDLRDRLLALAS